MLTTPRSQLVVRSSLLARRHRYQRERSARPEPKPRVPQRTHQLTTSNRSRTPHAAVDTASGTSQQPSANTVKCHRSPSHEQDDTASSYSSTTAKHQHPPGFSGSTNKPSSSIPAQPTKTSPHNHQPESTSPDVDRTRHRRHRHTPHRPRTNRCARHRSRHRSRSDRRSDCDAHRTRHTALGRRCHRPCPRHPRHSQPRSANCVARRH
jgi:hypothetical protein